MACEYRLILKYADEAGYTPDIECYLRHGGYEALRKALSLPPKTLPDGKSLGGPEQLREEVRISGLRGRGGAGFSCGLKWSFVDRKSGKPIYLICNADESEPGTFKDKQIIYKDPHQMLEGTIIACYANDVELAYIYIRGEFVGGAEILSRALKEARAKNFLGKNILGTGYDLDLWVHRGAGAYICGEETGLIESLEGKRAYPRIKPPYFPAVLGLYLCPTIVNNVETLCAVKHIVAMGDATDLIEALSNIAEFYAHESCGQCTPCREGSLWMAKALHRLTHGLGRKQDADYLLNIAQNIQGRTICAFGEACAWPVLSFVNKFKDEFEARGAADEARQSLVEVRPGSAPTREMKIAANPGLR